MGQEIELIQFKNEPSKNGTRVPDAIIQSSVRILVETKITRNALVGKESKNQIERHLQRLVKATETTKLLLVITPDDDSAYCSRITQ